MRIATWNVNSLKARMEAVEKWLAKAQPDVLLMQETKLSDADAPVMPFSMLGYDLDCWLTDPNFWPDHVHPEDRERVLAAFVAGRATGQPWWVAAATVGHDIDVIPIGLLRQRGILESTLRHEVAHAVVDAALGSRPVWVREGAAMYFANPTASVPGAGRVACPADAELLRPVSAGAQREAFARADRCFRAKLADGKTWRDVR